MAWTKTFNLAVKSGTYTQNGQNKFRYKTIGKVLKNDDGDEMLIIDRTFNPAGALQDKGDGVVLYRFEENDKDRARQRGDIPPARSQTQQEFEDDIPF